MCNKRLTYRYKLDFLLHCSMEKRCPVCENKIVGRSDKKFCNPECKSTYHYEKRIEEERFYLSVDRQLKVNRKILKSYNKNGFTTVRKETLLKEGFDPNYFTHYWKNKKGQVYLFVYDFGFLLLKKNRTHKYVIVNWQEYMKPH